jgi:hypothetical protein
MLRSKSRLQLLFRSSLEVLENRVQPSLLQASPPSQIAPALPFVADTGLAIAIDGEAGGSQGISPFATLNEGTFVTGTSAAAQGLAVALDATGNQFVGGLVSNGDGTEDAFIAKYLPGGARDTSFAPASPTPGLVQFHLVDASGNALPTEVHGIAVLSTGAIDVVGTVSATAGDHFGLFAQFDNTGALQALHVLTLEGPNTGPNSFNAIALDGSDDAFVTGVLSGQTIVTGGALEVAAFDSSGATQGNLGFDFSGQNPPFVASAGKAITVDPAHSVALVAGTLTEPGGAVDGLMGGVDLVAGIIAYFAVPNPAGNAAFNGAAFAPGSITAGFFVGSATAPDGTGSVSVLASADFVAGTANLVTTQDTTTSFAGLVVDASGNLDIIGTGQNPATGTSNILVLQVAPQPDGTFNVLNTVQVPGSGNDTGAAIALDSTGNVIGVGTTTSSDFPVSDATTLNGTSDAGLFSLAF